MTMLSRLPYETHHVSIGSCVGGGPMVRLVEALKEQGVDGSVRAQFTPEKWRSLMSSGPGGRIIARLGAYLLFPVAALWSAIAQCGGCVVPTTNPFFLPLWLVLTRPLHGLQVIPLIYDLYPDVLEASGITRKQGLTSRFLTLLNRFLFKHADGVVFIGQHMAEHVIARYGEPERWTVLETGADLREFIHSDQSQKTEMPDWFNWAEEKVLFSYVGNLGYVHDWDTLGEGIPALFEEQGLIPPHGLLMSAFGPGVEHLSNQWSSLPSTRLQFLESLPDHEWSLLLKRSDVAIVSLKESASRTSIPSKTFSAMAAGCAIIAIAPQQSDLALMVEKDQCGMVVPPGDIQALLKAMRLLIEDQGTRQQYQNNAIEAVSNAYDVTILASKWRHFLAEVQQENSPSSFFLLSKRFIDLLFGLTAALILSPVLIAAALAIRLTIGSPVLFIQDRSGFGERTFKLYKFRTMKPATQGEEGPEYDAERVTGLGRFLRSTSIDELPTLLNVIRGDMSLVGPRPLLNRYLKRYNERQRRRLAAKPGITGWAQVNGRNRISWPEKFELDLFYVDHRSLRLDLQILFKTAVNVLLRKDINQDGHATMPEFFGDQDHE